MSQSLDLQSLRSFLTLGSRRPMKMSQMRRKMKTKRAPKTELRTTALWLEAKVTNNQIST